MKIFIAGGAGFVGRNLIRILLNEGFKPGNIIVIDNNKDNIKFLEDNYSINIIKSDIAESNGWYNEVKDADYVINVAAQISSSNYDPFYKNNVLTTKNLIDACYNSNIKG